MNMLIRHCRSLILTPVFLLFVMLLHAQPIFQPVAVTGFNQDVVAEAGGEAGSRDVTTSPVDGSNHCLYTVSFGNEFQFGGTFIGGSWVPPSFSGSPSGGIPDNGIISSGRFNFQLADYTANNGLVITDLTGSVPTAVQTGTLTFVTPSTNIWYSVACFSAEQFTNLVATFNFTDGTSASSDQQLIPDWFNNIAGLDQVMGAMGWTTRSSPTSPHDSATSSNIFDFNRTFSSCCETQLYAWNIMVPCASQGKTVQSITFSCPGGSFSGTHRATILGIASYGAPSTPVVAGSSIPARCGNINGLAQVAYSSGGYTPISFSWDSLGVSGATVAGLPAGIYTCTVADSNGCTIAIADTIVAVSAPHLTMSTSQPWICAGYPLTLTATPDVNEPLIYTWTPGGQTTGNSLTITPSNSGQYYVTAQDFWGCTSTDSVQAIVVPDATATFTAPTSVCSNTTATITYTGNGGSTATFNWNGFAGATVESGSGAGPYNIDFSTPGTYNLVLAVWENGCTVYDTLPITVEGTGGSPVVVTQVVTTNAVTFSWAPVAGASGYQVSVNGGAYVDPSSGPTGLTEVVSGLDPNTDVAISVIALGGSSCGVSVAGTAKAKTFDDAVFIPSAFTPNGDGKNDVFTVYSNQATAIEMKVFNQWGQLVFATTDLKDGWDGTFKGKLQPSGVYIYTARITLLDGSQSVRKGPISLVR